MKKVEVKECNRGDWWVEQIDNCYDYQSKFRIIENVTKAIAKSIERHYNRLMNQLDFEAGEQIPIFFYADCYDNHDMGDMYGGRNLLMHS